MVKTVSENYEGTCKALRRKIDELETVEKALGNLDEFLRQKEQLVAAGDVKAMFFLGKIYEDGEFRVQNLEKANAYYQLFIIMVTAAASKGSLEGYFLKKCYSRENIDKMENMWGRCCIMDKYDRLLVIGDIHGKWERFQSVYDKIGFNAEKDLIVFLGDYLDRGDTPVPVMEWVMAHYGQKNMVFLRGNHEQMFYDAFLEVQSSDGHNAFSLNSSLAKWLVNGGQITYEEIRKTGRKDELISNWLRLIAKLPLCTEMVVNDRTYWFMHANCNPDVPLAKQDDVDLLWRRTLAESPNLHHGEQIIVLGHTPVQALGYEAKPQWLQNGRLVLMDTGSYLEAGRISCADLLSGEIYQSTV